MSLSSCLGGGAGTDRRLSLRFRDAPRGCAEALRRTGSSNPSGSAVRRAAFRGEFSPRDTLGIPKGRRPITRFPVKL